MENAIKSESQQAIIICGDEYKGLQPAANWDMKVYNHLVTNMREQI